MQQILSRYFRMLIANFLSKTSMGPSMMPDMTA